MQTQTQTVPRGDLAGEGLGGGIDLGLGPSTLLDGRACVRWVFLGRGFYWVLANEMQRRLDITIRSSV
jgi:hypothetical protein